MPLLTWITLYKFTLILFMTPCTDIFLISWCLVDCQNALFTNSFRSNPLTFIWMIYFLQFLFANRAFNAAIAKPTFFRDRSQFRLKTMNMNTLIAHLTDNHFMILLSALTFFTRFAIRAIPCKSINNLCIQRRLMTFSM